MLFPCNFLNRRETRRRRTDCTDNSESGCTWPNQFLHSSMASLQPVGGGGGGGCQHRHTSTTPIPPYIYSDIRYRYILEGFAFASIYWSVRYTRSLLFINLVAISDRDRTIYIKLRDEYMFCTCTSTSIEHISNLEFRIICLCASRPQSNVWTRVLVQTDFLYQMDS